MYFFPSLLSPNDTVTMLLPLSLPLIVCSIPPLSIPALPLFQPCDAEDHSLYFFEMPINLSTPPPLFFNNKKGGNWKVRSTPLSGLYSLGCSRMPRANSATGLIPSVTQKGFYSMGKIYCKKWNLKFVLRSSIDIGWELEYTFIDI